MKNRPVESSVFGNIQEIVPMPRGLVVEFALNITIISFDKDDRFALGKSSADADGECNDQ
jgi:hypothetical protein